MDTTNYMMNVINNAVFAQLDIVTNGTSYDEGVELFSTNSNGVKVGEHNNVLDFEDLRSIAEHLMKERESRNLSPAECGTFQGFNIKVIYNGGLRCHFEITSDGQVSEEYAEWSGHDALEVLN